MAGSVPPPDLPALRQPRRADYTDADSGSAARLVDPVVADGAAVNETPATFLGGSKATEHSSGPNWSLALLGAVGAVGLVAVVQLWPHSALASTGPTAAAPPAHAAAQAQAPAPAKPAPPPPGPVLPKAPVDLKITANSAVWVGVVDSSGRQLYGNVINAGQTMEFTDNTRLDVTMGNAAGLSLQLNGKPVTARGGDGQVVTASFGPAGQL
jgi:hypothetical protein